MLCAPSLLVFSCFRAWAVSGEVFAGAAGYASVRGRLPSYILNLKYFVDQRMMRSVRQKPLQQAAAAFAAAGHAKNQKKQKSRDKILESGT
jgi:hypothetical protein